jgi:hypothetical protein
VHWGFDGSIHQGIIEVHERVVRDAADFFVRAFELQFPFERVVRSSDPEFAWDDDRLMAANATSGFNYRTIAGTNELSSHALGAIDVNTRLNPYIRYTSEGELVSPPGAAWNPDAPGTLYGGHPLVAFMQERGWEWGGDWTRESGRIDYQHFQK